jgi:hemolysin III
MFSNPPSTAAAERAASPGSAYSRAEEVASAATHGLGALTAPVGLVLLVVQASRRGGAWHLGSAVVYGITMVLLFGASTLYHGVAAPRAKHLLKIFDHAAIYLLIAGSYTPFTLITLRPRGGLALFAVIWGCAFTGVALEACWVYRPKWLSALVYVAMGWLIIFMIKPLVAALAPGGLWLLFGGGLCYTLGTAFYALKGVRYMHAVWHLFVLGGGVCHFLSVLLFVMPAR